nr:Wzz/FepE/Etk N-terminal domain-containing protein [uncultured Steroidobacter sp.]
MSSPALNGSAERQFEEENVDLRDMLRRILARRAWVLWSVAACSAAFIAAAFLIRPVYRATAVMVSASAERNSLSGSLGSSLGGLGGLAALAGVELGANDSATEEALAVLKSRQFTQRFIAEEQLIPRLFWDKWDPAAKRWTVSEWRQPTPAKAYKYFDKKVRRVVQDKKSGLITLHIDWIDRDEATAWANELVRRINEEMRRRAVESANRSLGFLERELTTTTTLETRQAINRLIETQIKQRMLANVSEEYAFRVVDAALAPDKSDIHFPNRALLVVAGPLVGLFLGVLLALGIPQRRPLQ